MAQDAMVLQVPGARKDRSREVASIYVWRRRLLVAFLGLLVGVGSYAVLGSRIATTKEPASLLRAHGWGGLPACSQPLDPSEVSPIAFQSSRGQSLGLLTNDQRLGIQVLGSHVSSLGEDNDYLLAVHRDPLAEDGGEYVLVSVRGECILGGAS